MGDDPDETMEMQAIEIEPEVEQLEDDS
jgi:hypothetical protein